MEFWEHRADFLGSTENLVNGTTLYEVDTSKFFIWYKGTWYEQQ